MNAVDTNILMEEQNKTLGELSTQEFEELMDQVATPDFHALSTESFFTALAAIDAEMPHES
jgi:hypothetical protein